ncbi:MAG: translation initiation factor IF-3 [Rickettsiaceae bacterium]|nr:translation initiation factor IF-3 [Rickettsiaceae bacterium]
MSENRNNKFPRANKEIRAAQVRLVNANGDMVGVVKLFDAIAAAQSAGLDLVEISPQAEPPVCKIMDFGKYKYESKKRLQESRKKQKVVSVKEMKFRPNIGTGDFEIKVRNIRRFLEDGDKVRISMWFRGREIVYNDQGMALFSRIVTSLEDVAKVELEPRMEGKQILMILVPKS